MRSNAHGPRSATDPRPATRRVDPTGWRSERCCPMCRAPLPPALRAEARCSRCDAPLSTPPARGGASLVSSFQVTPGHAVRVITPSIDGVARVVACHRSASH
jgi:hypothetical protein